MSSEPVVRIVLPLTPGQNNFLKNCISEGRFSCRQDAVLYFLDLHIDAESNNES